MACIGNTGNPSEGDGKNTGSNRPNDAPPIPPEILASKPERPSEHSLPGFSTKSRSLMTAYSKTIRGCDQAVLNEFKNINVWLPDETEKTVPVIWGPQEKAVAIAMSDLINKEEVRIDRIKLPMMAISGGDMSFAPERFTYHQNIRWLADGNGNLAYGSEKRYGDTVYGKSRGLPVDKNYTLYAWTRYIEDMNQIVEQVMLKFCPIIVIDVPGVHWEVILKLDGVSNQISPEIGDAAIRIVKFEFSFHAETYISRGIIRGKTVLDIYSEVGLGDSQNFEKVSEVSSQASEEDLENLRKQTGTGRDLNIRG